MTNKIKTWIHVYTFPIFLIHFNLCDLEEESSACDRFQSLQSSGKKLLDQMIVLKCAWLKDSREPGNDDKLDDR